MLDYPLIAGAMSILELQKKFIDVPVFQNRMNTSTSIHQFAEAYLAYWVWLGSEPLGYMLGGVNSAFKTKGIELCQEVVKNIQAGKGFDTSQIRCSKAVRQICRIQKTSLAVGVGTDGGYGLTRYLAYGDRVSKEARSQRGGSYHKTKQVRTYTVHPLPIGNRCF